MLRFNVANLPLKSAQLLFVGSGAGQCGKAAVYRAGDGLYAVRYLRFGLPQELVCPVEEGGNLPGIAFTENRDAGSIEKS